jgi:hypothetical protein
MFDWKSKAFPGYRPVREPWMTKIVDVHFMDGLAVEFFDKAS